MRIYFWNDGNDDSLTIYYSDNGQGSPEPLYNSTVKIHNLIVSNQERGNVLLSDTPITDIDDKRTDDVDVTVTVPVNASGVSDVSLTDFAYHYEVGDDGFLTGKQTAVNYYVVEYATCDLPYMRDEQMWGQVETSPYVEFDEDYWILSPTSESSTHYITIDKLTDVTFSVSGYLSGFVSFDYDQANSSITMNNIPANTGTTARNGWVTVKGRRTDIQTMNYEYDIQICQFGSSQPVLEKNLAFDKTVLPIAATATGGSVGWSSDNVGYFSYLQGSATTNPSETYPMVDLKKKTVTITGLKPNTDAESKYVDVYLTGNGLDGTGEIGADFKLLQAGTGQTGSSLTLEKSSFTVTAIATGVSNTFEAVNLVNITATVNEQLTGKIEGVKAVISGNTVNVTFKTSPSADARTATITVSGDALDGSGTLAKSFTITQNGRTGGASITFVDTVQNVAYNAKSASNTMTTSNVTGLKASVTGTLFNAKATLSGDTINVTFDDNDTHQELQGVVKVEGTAVSDGSKYTASYTINQAANPKPEMSLAWTDKTVEAYDTTVSNTYIVNYGTDINVIGSNATTVNVTSFDFDEATREIVIKFSKNTDTTTDLKAYFQLKAKGTDGVTYSLPFQFTQKRATELPPSIELGWTSKSVEATATTVENTYTSSNLINLSAAVTGNLTNANVNISGGKITVTFEQNKSSLATKTGTVTVTGTRVDGKGDYSVAFVITQGKTTTYTTEVTANPTTLTEEGGTVNYTAVTNAPMQGTTANEDYIWVTGDNDGAFTDLGVTYDDATGRYTARAKSVLGKRTWATDQTWTVKFVPFYDGAFDYSCEPVSITQEGASPYVNLSFDNDDVTSKAGTNKFSGESNIIGEWTLSGTNCTVLSSATTGTYINGTVSYNANTASAARTISLEAKKYVGAVEHRATATFVQAYAAPSIEFANEAVNASATATEVTNIYSAVNVTGITASVSGTLGNASARLTSSTSGTFVIVSFNANNEESPRTGTVTLSGKDPDGNTVMKSFSVRQEGTTPSAATITLGWSSQTVEASATTIGNSYTADGVTGITATVEGTLVNASAYLSGGNVTVRFDANVTDTPRTGTVTLSGNGGKATAQFVVTQEGKKTVDEPSISFGWYSKNYTWEDTSSENTLTYSNVSDLMVFCSGNLTNANASIINWNGGKLVSVTFDKNRTSDPKQGTITVLGQRTDGNGAFSKSYTIIQGAFGGNIYVTTEETPNVIAYDGGVVYLTGTTNTLNYGGRYRWSVNQSFGDITEISSTTSNGVVTVKAKATCPSNATGVQLNFTVRYEPYDTVNGWLTQGNTVAFSQQGGQDVKEPSISFDWEGKVVDASSTQTTNEFSSRNLAGVSATATGGAKAVISGKVILVTYPTNTATSSKNYTVTLTGTRVDGYGTFSKSFTVTQSSAAAGDVEPVWKDDSVTIVGDYTQYTLFADGAGVYNGAVYGLDGRAEISVNDIAKQYLSNGDINWGSEKWTNGEYCRAFTIADDNGDTLFKRSYYNSYGYDEDIPTNGSLMILNAPIDPEIPFGAEIPFSVFSKASANYTIYKGDAVAYNGTNPSKTETNHLFRADGVNVPYTIGGKEYYRSVTRCAGQYVIYYVNAFGGWDALTVKGNSKRSDNITIYSYDRRRDNATTRHQTTRYMDDMTGSWELHTGWLDDQSSKRMRHLVESNLVYLYDLDKDKLIPVVMTDTKLSYLTYRNNGRKMVTYTIMMNESQKRDRR